MQLLQNIFSSPMDLLRKVENDKVTLEKCLVGFDEEAIREALFNFVVGCYHLVDWVKAYHPNLESDVYKLLNENKYLGACRDLCNASKHVLIDLNREINKKHPPLLTDVELSATGSMASSGIPEFKVKVQFGDGDRIPLEELIANVMSAWKTFFNGNNLK